MRRAADNKSKGKEDFGGQADYGIGCQADDFDDLEDSLPQHTV